MIAAVQQTHFGHLPVGVYPDNTALGQAAAERAARILAEAVAAHGRANVILATGNSQLSLYAALRQRSDIEWARIQIFHMDEYVGIAPDHPASFRRYLREQIVEPVQPAAFYPLNADAADAQAECERYAVLLARYPADLCCLGFGENGHLAFNDPAFARFDDDVPVKLVELDEISRRQQVGEGYFAALTDVPRQAITLTIPALLSAQRMLAIVPEERKAEAVLAALTGPISTACPASILRTVTHAELFLDRDSFSLVNGAH